MLSAAQVKIMLTRRNTENVKGDARAYHTVMVGLVHKPSTWKCITPRSYLEAYKLELKVVWAFQIKHNENERTGTVLLPLKTTCIVFDII